MALSERSEGKIFSQAGPFTQARLNKTNRNKTTKAFSVIESNQRTKAIGFTHESFFETKCCARIFFYLFVTRFLRIISLCAVFSYESFSGIYTYNCPTHHPLPAPFKNKIARQLFYTGHSRAGADCEDNEIFNNI